MFLWRERSYCSRASGGYRAKSARLSSRRGAIFDLPTKFDSLSFLCNSYHNIGFNEEFFLSIAFAPCRKHVSTSFPKIRSRTYTLLNPRPLYVTITWLLQNECTKPSILEERATPRTNEDAEKHLSIESPSPVSPAATLLRPIEVA